MMNALKAAALVAVFLVAGVVTTFMPSTESAANAPHEVVESVPAVTPMTDPIEVTDADGTVHTGCFVAVYQDDTHDSSVLVCADGFTEES